MSLLETNDSRRDRKSMFVSVLLLAGLLLGGASLFAQRYRIELVPRAQSASKPPASMDGSSVSPHEFSETEVILVDGCTVDDEPVLASSGSALPQLGRRSARRAEKTRRADCDDTELAAAAATRSAPMPANMMLLPLNEPTDFMQLVDSTFDAGVPSWMAVSAPTQDPQALGPMLTAALVLGPFAGGRTGIVSLPAQETGSGSSAGHNLPGQETSGSPAVGMPVPYDGTNESSGVFAPTGNNPTTVVVTGGGSDPLANTGISIGSNTQAGPELSDRTTAVATAVPEPTSVALLFVGLLGLLGSCFRRLI